MEAAKEAITKLTANHGHHETTVHEHYKPAVVHEQINPTREHVDTTVVDNEVHQDHHHTTVLPVKDREILPTEHSHQLGAQKHAEFTHGDHEGIKARVAAEAAQFENRRQTAAVEKTHNVAPTVAGEHHHHHVHETIQPIIQKQTVQPSVVHTTIPVHEVHHNEPKHYTASALPAVSMEEFKHQGGSLTGLADRVERFEGEPENIASRGSHGHTGHHGHHGDKTNLLDGSSAGTGVPHDISSTTGATSGLTGSSSHHNQRGAEAAATGAAAGALAGEHHHHHHNNDNNLTGGSSGLTGSNTTGATSGLTGSNTTGATSGLTGSNTTGTTSGLTGSSNTTGGVGETSRSQQFLNERDGHGTTTGTGVGSGLAGKMGTTDPNYNNNNHHNSSGLGHSDSHASTASGKPSLIDRLNPFKDSDKDGKKGMMD